MSKLRSAKRNGYGQDRAIMLEVYFFWFGKKLVCDWNMANWHGSLSIRLIFFRFFFCAFLKNVVFFFCSFGGFGSSDCTAGHRDAHGIREWENVNIGVWFQEKCKMKRFFVLNLRESKFSETYKITDILDFFIVKMCSVSSGLVVFKGFNEDVCFSENYENFEPHIDQFWWIFVTWSIFRSCLKLTELGLKILQNASCALKKTSSS